MHFMALFEYLQEIGQQNSTWYQGQRRETVPSSQQTRQNTVAQLLGISDSGPTARRKIHTAKRAITAPVHSESDLLLNDVQADRISKTADKRSTLPSPMEIIGNVENWLNSGGIKQKILQIISVSK